MKNKAFIIFCLCSLFFVQAKAQEVLDYPLDTINGEEVYLFKVPRSIGLYRVGVTFGVTQDVVIRYNPQLNERGLHYGETLIIPTGRPVIQESAPVVIETTVTETPVIAPVQEPVAEEPEAPVAQEPAVQEPAEPIIDEDAFFLMDTLAKMAQEYVMNLALLLPFESQQTKRSGNAERMLEFYQGALLALNDLKQDGSKYRLRVIDTGRSERRINELCDSTELDSVEGILGVVYPIQIERMSTWCAQKQIPLLLPFSSDEQMDNKPFVMQFNSTDSQQADSLCAWIKQRDVHCVALEVMDADMSNFTRIMRQRMQANDIELDTMTLGDLINDSATYALDTLKENLILLHSTKYQHVRILLPYLDKLSKKGYKIRIISQYSWMKEEINLPQVFTSMFTANSSLGSYQSAWDSIFYTTPSNQAPRYDLLGYDLMKALVEWTKGKKETEGLQSYIRWTQMGEGGWQNAEVKVVEKN